MNLKIYYLVIYQFPVPLSEKTSIQYLHVSLLDYLLYYDVYIYIYIYIYKIDVMLLPHCHWNLLK